MDKPEALKKLIQRYGSRFSRWFFTERSLNNPAVRWAYLVSYGQFKSVFERKEIAMLKSFIKSGSTVLDIGANVGWTAKCFAQAVGPEGKVLAFEPDPVVRKLGLFNTRNLKNVAWFPLALGAKEEETVFYQNLSNRADNRLHPDIATMPQFKRICVSMKSLSQLATQEPEQVKNVSFVKMDVQGSEAGVFEGMRAWLLDLKSKPVIVFEWWPYGLAKAGSTPKSVLDLVADLGYHIPDNCAQTVNRADETDFYENGILIPKS